MYHVIRVVKVWPVDHDYLYVYVFAVAGLMLLAATLCGLWLLRRIR